MDDALRGKILTLLDQHRIMTIATLRPDGWPQATTVGYVNEGLTLYFLCGLDSQKARNLARDDRVSLTIDHDTADIMAITGLSMAARACGDRPCRSGEGLANASAQVSRCAPAADEDAESRRRPPLPGDANGDLRPRLLAGIRAYRPRHLLNAICSRSRGRPAVGGSSGERQVFRNRRRHRSDRAGIDASRKMHHPFRGRRARRLAGSPRRITMQSGIWIAVGIGIGAAIGAAMDQAAMDVAFGAAFGVALGSIVGARRRP
jgi:hypothetical protein